MSHLFHALFSTDNSKNHTLRNTYQIIHQEGPLTKGELLEKTNLKQTTLLRQIYELLDLQLIREKGLEKVGVGRPAVRYEVVPDSGYIAAVDITRLQTHVRLVNLAFNTIGHRSIKMTSEHSPEKTINDIIRLLDEMLTRHQVPLDRLLGIGIGAVGPLDREQGKILNPEAFPAPGWLNVPLVDRIKQAFPVRIILENGANAAVFAEYHQSVLKQRNILYCISGEGFRCGVILNGQLVRTKTGDASAYGHITIHMDGKECSCGRKGCLTTYISIHSLKEDIRCLLGSNSDDVSLDLVVDKINQGEYPFKEAAMTSARYYGIGLGNMINLLHPDLVILSGALTRSCDGYYEEVIRHAREQAYFQDIQFSQGNLKEDAAVMGAAMLVFYSYFNRE